MPHAEEAAQEEAEELVQEVQPVALEANEVFKGISDGLIWNCPIGKHAEGKQFMSLPLARQGNERSCLCPSKALV